MPRINVKDKRKQQLMQATMDSIAKRGLSETTITHISKGAGMSRGIINFYFTSKEVMLQETLSFLLDEYEMLWQTALDKSKGDAAAKLEGLLSVHVQKKLCNAKRLNVLSAFWAHAASHEPYRTMIAKSDARVQAALSRQLEAMGRKSVDAAMLSQQLYAQIRGFWLDFQLGSTSDSQGFLRAASMLLSGAKAPKSKEKSNDNATSAKSPPTLVKSNKKQKDEMAGQMDIEDLFAAS